MGGGLFLRIVSETRFPAFWGLQHQIESNSDTWPDMKQAIFRILSAVPILMTLPAFAGGPIRVMLLDGESGGPYHKWKLTTPVLKKELEDTGLFQVEVITAPPSDGDFSGFTPEFSKYQAVVSNYDAPD